VTTFRRGMTIEQRRKLREEILQRQLERARRTAENSRLSPRCQDAMRLAVSGSPEAAAAHARCEGESSPTGAGCLCLCHDTVTGEVVAGGMEQLTLF
jgi:hypothetical protein